MRAALALVAAVSPADPAAGLLSHMTTLHRNLTSEQRMPTLAWVRRREADTSVLVQVGANSHRKNAADPDPGPLCVKLGWRSVLLEPIPNIFGELRHTYRDRVASPRLQLVNAAVCAETAQQPCSQEMSQELWFVDTTNATGNWGSNHSDARCLRNSGLYGWVAEIASHSKRHLLGEARNLQLSRSSVRRCASCTQELGRPLPPDCVRNMIHDNIRRVDVRCFCMKDELRLRKAEPAVTLLVVDAEGYDYTVLQQYPWERLPPWRVVFEATHLGRSSFDQAATLLQSHGYRHVAGGVGAYTSEWHHLDAP